MRDDTSLDFETLAAHAGAHQQFGEGRTTAAPITPSTSFSYETVQQVHDALTGEGEGYAYARNANPTVAVCEDALAVLDGASDAIAFGSGMAALHAALLGIGLESGDRVAVARDLYGVTRTLVTFLAGFDITTTFVDVGDLTEVERVLREQRPRALLFESMSNPLLRVPPIDQLIHLAREHRAVSIVDNTFATPVLIRPLELGADIVVHSATKYIAGHGDVMAGVVATGGNFGPRVRSVRTLTGGVLSPFEAWLTMRGIRTLPLRVRRQCETAFAMAKWLKNQEWVERVYYPGLAGDESHEHAARLFGGLYGGLVAADLRGDRESTLAFMDGLRLISPATTLGDVVSLTLYPPLSSHRTLTVQEQQAAGIGETLLRFSFGLESARDLQADLEGAATAALLPVTS